MILNHEIVFCRISINRFCVKNYFSPLLVERVSLLWHRTYFCCRSAKRIWFVNYSLFSKVSRPKTSSTVKKKIHFYLMQMWVIVGCQLSCLMQWIKERKTHSTMLNIAPIQATISFLWLCDQCHVRWKFCCSILGLYEQLSIDLFISRLKLRVLSFFLCYSFF